MGSPRATMTCPAIIWRWRSRHPTGRCSEPCRRPHWRPYCANSRRRSGLRNTANIRAVPKRNRPPEQPIKTGVMWQRPNSLRNGSDIERPAIKGVSTSQHMSHSVIRLACYLAVVCGVSLRHIALLFSVLFLIPITKSSIKRWIDDIGSHLPTPEQMLQHLLALTPATECHIDGYYPLGTDTCVMVVKDEHDRILITHEAASENGEDAKQFLQRCKDLGLKVTAAFSDYSQSFTEAIKAVFPHARFQADHFHTVKNIWGHLKKSLLSYRRQVKASGAEKNDEHLMALAKQLGFCPPLPQYYPAAGEYLRPFAQRSPSADQTQTAASGDQRG